MPIIVWNGSPLTLRHGGSSDPISHHGVNDHFTFYQNFPSFLNKTLPVYGPNDINTSHENTVVIPAKTNVYLLRVNGWGPVDLTGWTELSTGSYFNHYEDNTSKLYQKTFEAGEYILDNSSAMYLFVPGNHYYLYVLRSRSLII